MSQEQFFRERVIEFVNRSWSVADPAALDTLGELVAPGVRFTIGSRAEVSTLAQFQALVRQIKVGQPDLDYRMVDMVVQGNLIAYRLIVTGTHLGMFAGVYPPTGRRLTLSAMVQVRLDEQGCLVEAWQEGDFLGVLAQVGAIPPTGTGPLGQVLHSARTSWRLARAGR
ncbi:hypothetical protein GCM10010174_18030 [Kutzneria viridogrisea]|uniref:Ester cyclase n=2 Tax=Kutzneria TaxID=43356 RepID=W5WFN8_9PSEU|nr:ester cyclase [Kutzneria albida]AHH99622.1 hypothetical protein KALB_6262 [Kutzneria albida DSM 43870]MBA8922822.1 putative ester cyclase [Kutzneria viridogrisea]